MYVQESLFGTPEIFIDPNSWSDDGTVAMGTSCFSEDGEYCAYGVNESGSDWMSIKVMGVVCIGCVVCEQWTTLPYCD